MAYSYSEHTLKVIMYAKVGRNWFLEVNQTEIMFIKIGRAGIVSGKRRKQVPRSLKQD